MPAALLDDFSLLRFSGPDATTFLHGQLTCDVQGLKTGKSTYGGYCTPKGRLLATFLLWHDADGYRMLLPATIAEPLRKRLSMYILRAKVKGEDITTTVARIGVLGSDTASALDVLGGKAPEQLHGVRIEDAVTVIRLPGNRFLAIKTGDASNLATDSSAWLAADIANGIPFIGPATQEEFVPQMVNLDLIGALSYTKGCYPGQEIVARTHYLGRLKQRMYRASVAAAAPGDKLYCAELGDQAAGMIVSAAHADDGSQEVLAVLQTSNSATTSYHCGSPQGPALSLKTLPYPMD